jgi:hypothetical protein
MRTAVLLLAALAACASGQQSDADDTTAAASADQDLAVGGSGLPGGYLGRTDREGTSLADAKYTASDDGWEVNTGPAHILYRRGDSLSGTYSVSGSFEQLSAPAHPEAFGIFIGGQNLEAPTQSYTYFLVRGTGHYLLRVRDGSSTRNIQEWTASDAVPKQDAEGKASYRVTAQVTADSVRFLVNDQPVASVAKSAVSTDGTAGLRINHNLQLSVKPLAIQRGG